MPSETNAPVVIGMTVELCLSEMSPMSVSMLGGVSSVPLGISMP